MALAYCIIILFRGCDASWKDDVEVPEHRQEFSDDEQEMLAKQARKLQKAEGSQ